MLSAQSWKSSGIKLLSADYKVHALTMYYHSRLYLYNFIFTNIVNLNIRLHKNIVMTRTYIVEIMRRLHFVEYNFLESIAMKMPRIKKKKRTQYFI